MKIYGIVILCKDEDKYYNDYLENAFNSREKAEKVLKSSIKEEYESLIEDSTENYSLKDNCIYKDDEILSEYKIIELRLENE